MLRLIISLAAFWAHCAVSAPAFAVEPVVVSDVNGARIDPFHSGARRATVLIYITNDCPIANACAPEIERIYQAYAPKQVRLYLVYVDASLSAADARTHRKAYAYTCPAVLDPDHRLVRAGHALVTPEAAVFGADGKLIYHGRIDDRAVAFGQVRAQPLKHDLRNVLDAYLGGKPIGPSSTKSIGCTIADLGRK